MKLDARFINLIYKITDKDPQLTELNTDNIPEGALWINEATGKVFIAIKYPDNPAKIVWLMISDTAEDILSQLDFPTYNIVDIFNDNSIVAFYPFDGNVQDLANGYNGTWHGNEQYDSGKFGQAARFDGIAGTGIDIPPQVRDGLFQFTLSLWFKSDITQESVGRGIYQECIYDTDTSPYPGIQIWQGYGGVGTDKIVIRTRGNGKYVPIGQLDLKWHHILVVAESTQKGGRYNLYFDGRYIDSIIEDQYSLTNIKRIRLGCNYVTYDEQNLKGSIDQFRIFNRPLTPEEIIILYNENYLIKKALSILVDKFRTYKEIIFFPAGDLPTIQTGTKFRGGQIGQITNTRPLIVDTGKETIGKELYFPDNSAIELNFGQNITVPFTLATILQVDKLEQTSGVFDKVLIGLDYGGQPADGNFDFWIYSKNGKEISCNIGDNGSDKNASPDAKSIPIEPNNPYLLVVKIDTNSVETRVYDFAKKQFTGKFEFTTGNLNKLRESKLALGAWIWTSDTKDRPNQFGWFSNCGLHINQFRIFKGTLTNEEINLLLNEDKFYPVRTQYTPRVFVNKPSLNEDLIVFYNFDKIDVANKKVIDLSGNGYDGTWNGTPQYDKGIFGRAAKFTSGEFISIDSYKELVPNIGSISFWFNPATQNINPCGYNTQALLHIPNCGTCGCCGFSITLKNNSFPYKLKITFQLQNSCSNSNPSYETDAIIEANKWYHIAVNIYTGEIYLNGKLLTTVNHSYKSFDRIDGFRLGNSYCTCASNDPCHNCHFTGLIDQLRIYKRALSTDEIQTLYREMLWTIK